jgi:hypothetical protein
MPTSKPRVLVTLEPEQHELISLLGELRGVSKAQVVRELIEASETVLERVVTVLAAAQKAENTYLSTIKTEIEEVDDQIRPLVEQVIELFGVTTSDIEKKLS